ncbi:MAG: helix-turn-helix domain-containing protein [Eubacterium sp.]
MNYSELYENKKRGSFDFPIELYYVDENTPRYQMPLHWHLEYELITVLKGSFEIYLDGEISVLNEGDCVWIGDGVVHGGTPVDCIYECVVFDLGTLLHDTPVCKRSAAEFLASKNGFTSILRKGTSPAMLADKIFEAMEKEQSGYEWITVGLMWQLMGSLLSSKTEQTLTVVNRVQINKLKNVLTYIRDHYDSAVTLEELAQVAGMTPRYFCRAFSQITGKTPIAYLNYYRIESAGERLIMTDDKITDIALSCGFNDMSYFSKLFTREKGLSPSAYRKQAAL